MNPTEILYIKKVLSKFILEFIFEINTVLKFPILLLESIFFL